MAGTRTAPEPGSLFERWDERGLAVACLIAVCGSLAAALFGLSPAWQMPFLFTAVYAILRALVPLTRSHRELAGLSAEVASLRRDFDRVNTSRIEHYPDAASFYQALTDHLVHRGPRHLDTWYMRIETPDAFSESTAAFADYFRVVLDWARAGGSVRRLFCSGSGSSRGYADWITRHRNNTRDLHRYSVREVTWPIKADLMSMAIMDTTAVFLAFTVGDRVQGMRIEDSEAASYFKAYFDRHWENARDVPRTP
ncbi:hypothetical protein KQY30_31010 [Streptomyces sp. GMY02]|uniref:hypothetical protein n=1 Tax=Streptomyces sp. GMY02 TaxID=1333528 RepID=UPI001C2C8682|nr:hypothetical protein [Streptomyces sp. GMY02]QXE38004.1 hypothetical protein KQY30_31010 [Streptomyces sp. GMY02]